MLKKAENATKNPIFRPKMSFLRVFSLFWRLN